MAIRTVKMAVRMVKRVDMKITAVRRAKRLVM